MRTLNAARRLVATVLLAISAPAAVAEPTVPAVVVQSALKVACEFVPEMPDCLSVEPRVAFAPLFPGYAAVTLPGLVLMDDAFIEHLRDPARVDTYAFSILVHEMVHVLDYELGRLTVESMESLCASEARAWDVTNRFLVRIGEWQQANWDWRVSYPHCQMN